VVFCVAIMLTEILMKYFSELMEMEI